MARRRRKRTRRRRTRRVYTRARRTYRRARGSMKTKQIIDGALAGVAAQAGSKYLGNWGTAVGYGAVGMFRNNTTLQVLGGVALGRQIAGMIPFIGNGGNGSNGGVFEG